MYKRIFPLLLLLGVFAACANAQTDAWLEVRTPHFMVISNSNEKESRRVSRQFERMRSVFLKVFPDANIDPPTSIVVLAVEDKRNLEALEPQVYLAKGQLNVAGVFLRAPEKNYVLVRLNAPGLHPFAPIYHEYTHFVMSRAGEWMPAWLSEGWAEFYQNTEILETEIRLGKADAYTLELLKRPLLPLETLFTVDQHSPYYHEEDKGSMFYAESWALTHYLKMKDAQENTHLLANYLDLVHKNVDSVSAAAQAFGDLQQLQASLQKYIVNGDYGFLQMQGATEVDESSFTVRALPQGQVDAVRADFLAYNGRDSDARILLEAVLRDDPVNVSAHETMGLLAIRRRNFDEAHKWYEQAVKLDSQSFLAQYYFASSALKKGLPNAAAQASIENSLRTAMKLNPSFASPYYGMGVLVAMQGKSDAAHQWIQKAIQMDPGNVEFRIDDANILMRMNKDKDAIETLEVALKMAHMPEETAAVENVLQSMKKFVAERARTQHQNLSIRAQASQSGSKGATQAGVQAQSGPRVIYNPEPEYTEEARQARRGGTCSLSLIVGVDGKPRNIVVTKKVGMGLDEKAIEAVGKWKFEPARRYGRPVMARLNLSLNFKVFGDSDRIVELSQRAKIGDAAAEFELANAFFEGREMPKDESQGMALLERAARDGLAQAQFQMGERARGDGSDQNSFVAAYVWYALAQRGGLEQSYTRINELEAKMSAEQLSEAQKRLENWAPAAVK